MTTNTAQPPRDLIGFLDFYLVQKAPFQLPDNVKEWVVQFGPWITVVLLVLALPTLLFALGVGTALMPFGGVGYAMGFTYAAVGALLEIGLMVAALPGLFARKMSGWQLIFYAQIVGFVFSVLRGAFLGGLLGTLIALYVLFQVRPLYRA